MGSIIRLVVRVLARLRAQIFHRTTSQASVALWGLQTSVEAFWALLASGGVVDEKRLPTLSTAAPRLLLRNAGNAGIGGISERGLSRLKQLGRANCIDTAFVRPEIPFSPALWV